MPTRVLTCAVTMKDQPVLFGEFLEHLGMGTPIRLQSYAENRANALRVARDEQEDEETEEQEPDEGEPERRTGRPEAPRRQDTGGRMLWLGPVDDNRIAGIVALQPREQRYPAFTADAYGNVVFTLRTMDTQARQMSFFVYDREVDGLVYQYVEHEGLGPRGFLQLLRGPYSRLVTQTRKEARQGRPRKEHKSINEELWGALDFDIVMEPADLAALLEDINRGTVRCTIATPNQARKEEMGPWALSQKAVEFTLAEVPPDRPWTSLVNSLKERFTSAKMHGVTSKGTRKRVDLFNPERLAALDEQDYSAWLDEMGELRFNEKSFPVGPYGDLLGPIATLDHVLTTRRPLMAARRRG